MCVLKKIQQHNTDIEAKNDDEGISLHFEDKGHNRGVENIALPAPTEIMELGRAIMHAGNIA